ncbi:MAG: DUF4870 domain-containing protein [Verrucomicrobiota bacterium]
MESIPPPQDGGAPQIGVTGPTKDERTMAMICHLLPLAGALMPAIPILNIVAPLVLWLIKKDTMPFVNDQGKEVLNFQITVSIAIFVCIITILLIPVAILVGIAALVLMIIAAIKSNEGVAYRYPYILRLIK